MATRAGDAQFAWLGERSFPQPSSQVLPPATPWRCSEPSSWEALSGESPLRRSDTGSLAGVTRSLWLLALVIFCLQTAPASLAQPITFRDVTKSSGIDFVFSTDMRRGRMISTMGGGVAAADYDGDGFLDLYFTGSVANGRLRDRGPCGRLYRNRGDGTFEDATLRSGIRSCGWQMGAAWVDYDSDGRPDLVVTGIDATRVWHNEGNGTFRDVTRLLGIDVGRQFTIGVAAADEAGTGRVSLYLLGYLDTTPEKELTFPALDIRFPEDYGSETGILYRPGADGIFRDATAEAGVDNRDGKGTGAVFFDYNGDGRPDLYVANDRVSNRLYRNEGEGRFRDVTEETGAGARDGLPRAGMGIAVGDPFGRGFPDIFVTNFSGQPSTYYRNVEGALFEDGTDAVDVGRASLPYVQWGTGFADFDDDGWPDLYAVSGHLVPRFIATIAGFFSRRHLRDMQAGDRSFRQPITLWRNGGSGRFEEVSATAGDLARVRLSARGSAAGDFDGDGRPDLVVTAISGGLRLFRNATAGAGHAIEILPAAGADRRTVLGTKVRVIAGGRIQTQEFGVTPSYASGSWTPLHFGLGDTERAQRIEVIPPWSTAPRWVLTDVAADRLYRLRDGALEEIRRFRR